MHSPQRPQLCEIRTLLSLLKRFQHRRFHSSQRDLTACLSMILALITHGLIYSLPASSAVRYREICTSLNSIMCNLASWNDNAPSRADSIKSRFSSAGTRGHFPSGANVYRNLISPFSLSVSIVGQELQTYKWRSLIFGSSNTTSIPSTTK